MKPVVWVGDSLEVLRTFPDPVQDTIGYALYLAQTGGKHPNARPLGGDPAFRGVGVLEIIDDYDGDTYRAIYTVRFREVIYVLHVFQKKSKHGIATPRQDIDLIKRRLRVAEQDYQHRTGGKR